jgi:hypothetical protein
MSARPAGASEQEPPAPGDSPAALDWASVLEAEYEALFGCKPFVGGPSGDPESRLRQLHRLLHERRPAALCLSGGGVRSATFGLGVLQGLAKAGVLGHLHYLSTVSGGGYVGGWLTAWLRRARREEVLRTLADPRPADGAAGESAVDRLRSTCRYLAPQGGVFSADRWTLFTTMGRNLLLNWLVLLPLIAATLLVPRLYLAAVTVVERNVKSAPPCLPADQAPFWFALLSLSMFVVAIGYVVMNFAGHGEGWSQRRFLSFVVVPTLLGTLGLTLFWSAYPCEPNEGAALIVSALLPAAGWLVIGVVARRSPRPSGSMGGAVRMPGGARTVVAALLAGPIVGLGAYWFAHEYFDFGRPLGESYAVFAVPGIFALILLANTVFLGLASDELDNAALEWWNRFAAWLAIVAALWLIAGGVVIFLADLVEVLVQTSAAALALEHRTSASLVSVVIPLLSSLAGLAARQGSATDRPSGLRIAAQAIVLPIVILSLLATLAWFNAWALRGFTAPAAGDPAATLVDVLQFGAFLFVLGMLVSGFVPVNRFSLHGMYRQRLVRTFLGASHADRQPNAFTGFDPNDDLRVHDLAGVRPLHVINATLNNVQDTSYGRNERKAYAFAFTPLHVGSPTVGYRRSCEYGSDGGGMATGLSLGMALAVSGAAASPEMGIYTSKARAFLLTVANARLGLWFGNPSDRNTWGRSDPALGIGPLVRELLGLATDHNPYVYLSDGGHFENLGLWAMVQRRCGVIIVSDAGCDPAYTFDDLSNAVRRIRLDFGIPVEFEQLDLSRAKQGDGNPHVAVGTIRYSVVDGPDAPDGLLLYIKATLSGDEPVDVRNFAARDGAFPHDSTSEQFFAEDRFESYRALGYHSIEALAELLEANPAWDVPGFEAMRSSSGPSRSFAPGSTAHV